MEINFSRFKYLFNQYTDATCSENERNEFFEMVRQEDYSSLLKELINEKIEGNVVHRGMNETKADEIFNKILQVTKTNIFKNEKNTRIHFIQKYRFKWWAAAIVLVLISTGAYVFSSLSFSKEIAQNVTRPKPLSHDLAPGHSGAILTLSNGKTILLDSAQNGILINQGNTHIIKKDGLVSYDDGKKSGGKILYNTMTTPKGRQYQLVLSDGSKVWLNAASSITYPTVFAGTERRVKISGEAYFEIKHISLSTENGTKGNIPFIVEMDSPSGTKREIKVLGTHFNVMDYDNEASEKTTLLEGSVKITGINSTVIIKPGEQAIIDNRTNKFSVVETDVNEAVAWKNGYFSFKSATIETIMRQVERWYDVEVIYKGVKPSGHYRGEVPMDVNASEMLKVLESGIHFNIEGKKIIVGG